MAGSAPTLIIVSKNEDKEEVSIPMTFETFTRTRHKNQLTVVRYETPEGQPLVRKAYLF